MEKIPMIVLEMGLTFRISFSPFGNEVGLLDHNRALQDRLKSFRRQGRLQNHPALRFNLLQLTEGADLHFIQRKSGISAIFEILFDPPGRGL